MRFNSFVVPGQTMDVHVDVRKRDVQEYSFTAKGSVAGKSTVSARLTLEQFNLADRNPALAAQDERLITHMRQLFAQVWPASGD